MRTELIAIAISALPSLAAAQSAPAAPPAPAPPAKAPKTVEELVVTGRAPPVQTAIDRRSYSVAGDLQAQTGAIADALRNVPSVEVDVQGNVSLRGDPNVTILIDGKPSGLFQGDNKGQALQTLPADSIERVEVITNPSAEFRADGSGGVINLISKKARGAGVTGSARLSLGNGDRQLAGGSFGYNSNRLTVAGDLTVRQDRQKQHVSDDRLQPDPSGPGLDAIDQAQVVRLRIDSGAGRTTLDYDLTPKTRIGGELRGNYTDFQLGGPTRFTATDPSGAVTSAFLRQLDISQSRFNGQVGANLRHEFAPDQVATLSLSREQTVDDRVRSGRTTTDFPVASDAFDQQRLDNHLERTLFKGDYTRPEVAGGKLKLGFEIQHDDNSYRNRGFRGPADQALAPDASLTNLFLFRQTLSQAYATYERPLGPLTALVGLRVEDDRLDLDQATLRQSTSQDDLRLFPSLHLAWKLDDARQLTANYSHRVQRPDPGDYNAFRFLLDPLNFRSGNPDLQPQQTDAYELGYEYRRAPVLFLATAYWRENRDGVTDIQKPLGGGVILTQRGNAATSRSGGVELVANGRLAPGLTYNLSANLAWTQLDSLGPAYAPTRDLASVSGRSNLTWQATPADLAQLNLFLNGARLTPQGEIKPVVGLNLGYRHKFSDRLAFTLTAQDILGTFGFDQTIDTPALKERQKVRLDTRVAFAALVWTFGGGRAKDPAFEFQNGGGTPQ